MKSSNVNDKEEENLYNPNQITIFDIINEIENENKQRNISR
jgi:hypothetical protein